MLLDLYFHQQNSVPKSGVNRMWLVEYYMKELAKKEVQRERKKPLAPATLKRKQARREVEVAQLADKAEKDLDVLAQGIADAQTAQVFIQRLIAHAQVQVRAEPEFDFLRLADAYRKKMRDEDDELLLLASAL